jgi:hypothetical protein|tara:strand:+ start:223 stop:531 length:309 start_codon:yes stop_codon:yes gene_type:complete
MAKATESKLAALHQAVAQVLTEQVLHEEEETTFDGEGETVGTGMMIKTATPALLATAARFLKDNDITCDVEQDENMSGLKDILSNKQRHSRLKDATEEAKAH